MVLQIGPTWPQDLNGVAAWNATIEAGYIFDRIVSVGFMGEFMWNVSKIESRNLSGSPRMQVSNKKTSYMFPLGGYASIDPFPHLMIHPVAKFGIAWCPLFYFNEEFDNDPSSNNYNKFVPVDTGAAIFYQGLMIKVALDALYDFGESASISIGLHYTWAPTRGRREQTGNDYEYLRDMSNLGPQVGFRFVF